eukprot:351369-Chlamydomonas_euryale.AAC.2
MSPCPSHPLLIPPCAPSFRPALYNRPAHPPSPSSGPPTSSSVSALPTSMSWYACLATASRMVSGRAATGSCRRVDGARSHLQHKAWGEYSCSVTASRIVSSHAETGSCRCVDGARSHVRPKVWGPHSCKAAIPSDVAAESQV